MTARYVRVIGALAVVLVLSLARSAGAQDRSAAVEAPSPKVEFGAVTSGFLPPAHTYGLGVRVSKTIDDRFSFEAELDWMELGRKWRFPDQVIWLYFWQVKQALATHGSGPRFFVTYGTAGWVERTSHDGKRFDSGFIPPLAPMLGFGGDHVVAKHAAVRVDAQLVWLLGTLVQPRFSGGVSIPIGGYQR